MAASACRITSVNSGSSTTQKQANNEKANKFFFKETVIFVFLNLTPFSAVFSILHTCKIFYFKFTGRHWRGLTRNVLVFKSKRVVFFLLKLSDADSFAVRHCHAWPFRTFFYLHFTSVSLNQASSTTLHSTCKINIQYTGWQKVNTHALYRTRYIYILLEAVLWILDIFAQKHMDPPDPDSDPQHWLEGTEPNFCTYEVIF